MCPWGTDWTPLQDGHNKCWEGRLPDLRRIRFGTWFLAFFGLRARLRLETPKVNRTSALAASSFGNKHSLHETLVMIVHSEQGRWLANPSLFVGPPAHSERVPKLSVCQISLVLHIGSEWIGKS